MELVDFENTYMEDTFEEDIEAFACITIDGYPQDETKEGAVVAKVWMSLHGDLIIDWHHNGYRLNPSVLELIDDSKNRLKALYDSKTQCISK